MTLGKIPPCPRRIARLLTMGRDHLNRADAIQIARIEAALPALATVRELTDRFTDMVRNSRENALAAWLDEAEDSMLVLSRIRPPGDWKPLPATPFMAGSGGGCIAASLALQGRMRE